MPERVMKQISVDESFARWVRHETRLMAEEAGRRWRLAQVIQKSPDGINRLLRVERVLETPNGVIIEVV